MSRHTFEITLSERTGAELLFVLDQFIHDEHVRARGGEVATSPKTVEFAKHFRALITEEMKK